MKTTKFFLSGLIILIFIVSFYYLNGSSNHNNSILSELTLIKLFLFDDCSQEESSRITSSDGRIDAVMVKTNCGATTGYSYNIFIVPKGKQPSDNDSVFSSDKTEDLNISWASSSELLITYREARIFQFTNFWQSEDIDNFNYVVSIVEQSYRMQMR